MAAPGAGGWLWDPTWSDASGADRALHVMLADTEAAFRKSADLLRACGSEEGARRVQRFAEWARFDLDEPVVARRLYLAVARLRRAWQLESLASDLLEEVLSLARADRGNVQLADPESGTLRIIAQHGFDEMFLHHFKEVTDDGSACGRAAKRNAQLVITDVLFDRGFEPHREIAASSGFRAVQSTPLADREGRLVGMVSTHYSHPYALPARDMRIIRRYADLAGQVLAARLRAVAPDGESRLDGPYDASGNHRAQVSMATGSPTATRPGVMVEP